MSSPAAVAESETEITPDSDTRVVDGAKEFRVRTTRGARFLLRALVGNAGWYTGTKEFARRKRLGRAIGKDEAPKDDAKMAVWDKEPCEFWLTDRLKEHARKCLTFFLDKGALSGALDDDSFDSLMIDLGIEITDG